MENQEANELDQMSSGYKIPKEELEELVEIKDKLMFFEPQPKVTLMPKIGGHD